MASICSYSCAGFHHKYHDDRFRQFNIRKRSLQRLLQSVSKEDVIAKGVTAIEPIPRRSANYAPSLWSFDYVQSLSSKYKGEYYKARVDTLKESVRMMIHNVESPLSTLELVDDLQRLGISYHFEDDIRSLLEVIYNNYYRTHDKWNKMDLNLKALGFRLMIQHGYLVSQEIFDNFEDMNQNLKANSLKDMMGLLNLYEASYHSFEDENILDDVRDFTAKHLEEKQDKMDEVISSLVSHALELPLHWRVPRVESKWFIEVYKKRIDMNPTFLELARLDFNMVQAVHIEDIKHESRWWRNTNWVTKLSFIRDSLVPSFLWTIGVCYQPHYSLGRNSLSKAITMITAIDDIYDVYGTLDELEQFTDAIDRWDINAIEKLPDYMKICFLGFYNTINEISYNTLKNSEILILPYLKKEWEKLCKAYLVEARWYYSGYTPTLLEYLDNGCVSIDSRVVLMHAKLATSVAPTEEILQHMSQHKNIDHYSSLISRLADDLGTSTDELARGDVPKSIQCYMHETGETEEARKYIKKMIRGMWKKLNKERARANSQLSREFVEYASNLARMAQFMYGKGDGHARPDITKSYLSSLLFNPILGTK
ncbi:R-linalool synthase QH1, chloroplastic-like [Bidens hawaiensis]|uniref:R-linalool synthase QH1, chloroplastic-like n=1 Tax=Bidens hawaiensis TaxID=980011 RepID=UPI0040498D67